MRRLGLGPASRITLYVQRYKSDNANRQLELDIALTLNQRNPNITVKTFDKQDRMTFKEMVDWINSNDPTNDDISVFANSDMVLDENITLALEMEVGHAFCISRYDVRNSRYRIHKEDKRLIWNPESSDTWVFRGKIRDIPNIDFGFGIWACDGAFIARLEAAGYKVINPCLSIFTYHIHSSGVRTNQYPSAPPPLGKAHHCYLTWDKNNPINTIQKFASSTKVISFSLYGNNPLFVDGVIENSKLYKHLLGDDWKTHVSIGSDVSVENRDKVIANVDSHSIKDESNDARGMLWRGMVEADVLLIRDADAKPSPREIVAIKEWLTLPHDYCVIHDHDGHKTPILGGLFSIKGPSVKKINLIYAEKLNLVKDQHFPYGADEVWLKTEVYPFIKNNCVDFTSQPIINDFKLTKTLSNRVSENDVIGDGIGKYYGQPIQSETEYLRQLSKQWTKETECKAWVSFGSIIDDYHGYYEPVSKMWNKFGYKVFYTLLCDENSIERNEYGIILRIKTVNNHTYDSVYGRNYVWQAQISRLYAASFIDGIMMTSDSDSMPLQAEYFDTICKKAKLPNVIVISRKKPYHDSNKYCMMWTATNAGIFERIFKTKTTFENFCNTFSKHYPSSFVSDEQFLTDAINISGYDLKFMDHLPVVRIDRLHWYYDIGILQSGGYTDSHLLRPYEPNKYLIRKLMTDRFPNI